MAGSRYLLNGRTYRSMELFRLAMRRNILRKAARMEESVAIELASEMRDKTPVLTGTAKSNWYVTRGELPGFDPGKTGSKGLNIDLTGTGPVRIGNPTPYIRDLEFGSSDQAPTGFTRLTLQNLSQFVVLAAAKDK